MYDEDDDYGWEITVMMMITSSDKAKEIDRERGLQYEYIDFCFFVFIFTFTLFFVTLSWQASCEFHHPPVQELSDLPPKGAPGQHQHHNIYVIGFRLDVNLMSSSLQHQHYHHCDHHYHHDHLCSITAVRWTRRSGASLAITEIPFHWSRSILILVPDHISQKLKVFTNKDSF